MLHRKGNQFFNKQSMFRLHKLRSLSRLHHVPLREASLYEVLGVKEDATDVEIKSAYFALSKKFHPDYNLDLDTKLEFMQVQHAYKVLSSPRQRTAYDNAFTCLTQRAVYHDIYRSHEPKPSPWEYVRTPSLFEQVQQFHNCSRNTASDPPPIQRKEMSQWEKKWRTNYVTVFTVIALTFSAWAGYRLWEKVEGRELSSNESLKNAYSTGVSPLRAQQERKSADLAQLKDLPRREGGDK
ncbi:uncharacterized protein [Argopecten irradians]|uniref:uncharacterized protein n=1 Tax=Argopecten irradians TaxID=31199 RepID=UPI003710670C